MVEHLFLAIASAIIIEEVLEVLKNMYPRDISTNLIRLISIIFGIVFAVNFNLDILGLFGFVGKTCIINITATGIIIGSGSGFVHDIVDKVQQNRETKED